MHRLSLPAPAGIFDMAAILAVVSLKIAQNPVRITKPGWHVEISAAHFS
jgi:hypothetical protein